MDGVLVDSYEAHRKGWSALAAEEGLPYTDEDFARTFGRTSRETIAELWPARVADAERLDARKEALYRSFLSANFVEMPGTRKLIRALHQAGFALAVASSGPPENVELVLARLDVIESFAAVVTGREIRRGKPDPEVFLLAAERLGVRPARCVVVEDAPVGVAAAHAGGMAAVALLSTGRRREDFALVMPELVVGSLDELDPARFAALLADT
jgi:beta-phosphoglucomutase